MTHAYCKNFIFLYLTKNLNRTANEEIIFDTRVLAFNRRMFIR